MPQVINASSARMALKCNATLTAYDVNPGDLISPNHIVVDTSKVDPNSEYFWFNGGPDGVALQPGVITAEFDVAGGTDKGDPKQERVFNGRDDGAGVESDPLTGDDILPIPATSGVKINFPAPPPQQDNS